MELLFVFALLLIILYYFYKKKPKNHYPVIQYQDHKKHVLNYKKIQTMNTPIKDLQYVYYLLSLIDELPQDKSILIYLLLKKWNEQKDISLEEKDYELSIHFLKTYTNNRAEDQLFQMLYAISIDQIVDDKTLRIWVENDYLKDMKNKLRQEHHFVDDCYSLDIYEDLKRLLGYEKYLDGYKEIETEEEMKYALLFGLKECPYPMYSCFVMQNIEADYGVSRGSGLY
ncbi:hypothetical protein [Faecalibacillus intestinalis]|uniref:hypothetical protein n=1 Tax=Faecalibacillus intestinalis TaxID=1982626 RepID=UPI0022E08F65|nr:hypothetical protein [Faecalibacillus intestinalis]